MLKQVQHDEEEANGWRFSEGELDQPDVRDLLRHHFAEMRADSPPEACHVLPSQSLRSPDIRFFTARGPGGELFGVGALQTLEPGHGEVKSMRRSMKPTSAASSRSHG